MFEYVVEDNIDTASKFVLDVLRIYRNVVTGINYILPYRVVKEKIQILVFHTLRERADKFEHIKVSLLGVCRIKSKLNGYDKLSIGIEYVTYVCPRKICRKLNYSTSHSLRMTFQKVLATSLVKLVF